MRLRGIAGLILVLLCLQVTAISAAEVCIEPDPLLPSATLILKHAEKGGDSVFAAEFELENRSIDVIEIPGRSVNGKFHVDYPDASVEFKDINGIWNQLIDHAPGTYLSSPGTLKVGKGSKVSLRIELFSGDRRELSGVDFRVKIRVVTPATCIVSYPFRTYPERSAITRIESLSKPHHQGRDRREE